MENWGFFHTWFVSNTYGCKSHLKDKSFILQAFCLYDVLDVSCYGKSEVISKKSHPLPLVKRSGWDRAYLIFNFILLEADLLATKKKYTSSFL